VTSPPSRLTCWIVDDPVAAAPVAVVFDAADVSIVPDDRTPAFTAAAVFVRVTPVADVQPRVDSADRPDRTSVPTVTDVPSERLAQLLLGRSGISERQRRALSAKTRIYTETDRNLRTIT
jgi:hypothetical protein